MDERSRYREFEDQFLNQLTVRALALTRGKLPADDVVVESTPEGVDAIRAELGRLEVYDKGAIDKMPGSQSLQLRFTKKILGGLVNTTRVRLRARVLSDVEALVKGESQGPIGREQVRDALAHYEVLRKKDKPSAVVLASATGFTSDAKAMVNVAGEPTLILLGGREDGGWDLTASDTTRNSPWAKLFDLETRDDRLKRLNYHLEQNAALLDSRGITVAELSEKLGLPRAQTELLVRRACRNNSRLMTVARDGTMHVCRAPFADEGNTMTIWRKLKKMLGFKATPAETVRDLTGQRVQIEQQRYELDQRVDTLEADEREILAKGAKAASKAEKHQLAGRLQRARGELKRVRGHQQLFTQQINIIGTQIHNLTMAEQGRRVSLPKAEDLTTTAAEAEQVVAELAANADLAASIEVTPETPMMADEQDAILAEFDQIATDQQEMVKPETAEQADEPATREAAADRPVGDSTRAAASEPPEIPGQERSREAN